MRELLFALAHLSGILSMYKRTVTSTKEGLLMILITSKLDEQEMTNCGIKKLHNPCIPSVNGDNWMASGFQLRVRQKHLEN